VLHLRFKPSHVADQLTLRLLWNFTDQRPSPPLTGSLVYSAYSYLFAKAGSSISSEAHPIADRSVLVLLLLLSQAKLNPSSNAFKNSIRSIRDERGRMDDCSITSSAYVELCFLTTFIYRINGGRPKGGDYLHFVSQNLPCYLPVRDKRDNETAVDFL